MNRKKCPGCEVQFVVLRSDAVTCSPRCRQRYKRHCDKINREAVKRFEVLCAEVTTGPAIVDPTRTGEVVSGV